MKSVLRIAAVAWAMASLIAASTAFGANFLVNLGPGVSTGCSTDGSVVAGNDASNSGFIWSAGNGVKTIGGVTAGVAIKTGAANPVVVGGVLAGNASRWNGTTAGVGTWNSSLTTLYTTAWTPTCTAAAPDGTNVWVGGYENLVNGGSSGGWAVRYVENSSGGGESVSSAQRPNGNDSNYHRNAYILSASDVGTFAQQWQWGGNLSKPTSGDRQAAAGAIDGTAFAFWTLTGTPDANHEASAKAISRDGTWAAGFSYLLNDSNGNHRAGVLWQLTSSGRKNPVAVPFNPTSDNYAEIHALNADGTLAGGFAQNADDDSTLHAILYDRTTNTTSDVAGVLAGNGINVVGWIFTDVTGISANGTVLTGNGTFQGVNSAWVAQVPGPVPTGACCVRTGLGTGTCSSQAQSVCQAAGGSYGGDGASCGANNSNCNFCPTPWADADFDGDVDQDDFAVIQVCYTGAATPGLGAGCACLDHDKSAGVDDADLAAFEACRTGPDVPSPGCP